MLLYGGRQKLIAMNHQRSFDDENFFVPPQETLLEPSSKGAQDGSPSSVTICSGLMCGSDVFSVQVYINDKLGFSPHFVMAAISLSRRYLLWKTQTFQSTFRQSTTMSHSAASQGGLCIASDCLMID